MAQLPSQIPSRIIDFSSPNQKPNFSSQRQLRFGNITLTRGTLSPTSGIYLGAEQVIVARHYGIPVQLDWRAPGTDAITSKLIVRGAVHVKAAREQFWQRWSVPASILVIAFDAAFFDHLSAEADNSRKDLIGELGIADAGLIELTGLFDREFLDGGLNGRFYVENLGAALAAYLVRRRTGKEVSPHTPQRAQLAPARLRRVLEYIDAHLNNELGLAELAAIAGLNSHHFAHAFKITTGVPPHQFIMDRRINASCLRLEKAEESISDIALACGFASQSHFTKVFRRFVGTTPAKYRRQV